MEPLVLPLKPQPLLEESAAAFNDRMLNWWRECDILLRADCQEKRTAFIETLQPMATPTLTKFFDAWDAFDVRLGELAGALSSQPAAGAFPEAFVLSLLRLVLDKPEAPAAGG